MINMFGKVQEDSFQSIFDLSLDDLSSPLTSSESERNNSSSSSKMSVGAMAAQLGLLGSSSGNMRGSSHQSTNSSQETATLSANLVASLIALQKQQQQQQSSQGSPISPGAWGSSSAWGFGQRSQQQQHPLSLQQQLHQHQQCPPESPTSSISSFDSCGINMRQRMHFNDSALDSDSSSGSIPSSSASSSSGSSTAGSKSSSGVAINSSRYKTELCRPFQENGTCKYGDKCQFAHGLTELRTISRHPKYKTDLCKTYHSSGFCPYGPRCHFIHNLEEQQAPNAGAPNGQQRQQQTAQTKPEKENPAQIAPLPIFQSQRHQVERQQEAVIRSAAAQMMGLMNNDLDNGSGRQQQQPTTHMQQLRSSERLSPANNHHHHTQHQHQFQGQHQNTRQTSSRLPVFSTLYN